MSSPSLLVLWSYCVNLPLHIPVIPAKTSTHTFDASGHCNDAPHPAGGVIASFVRIYFYYFYYRTGRNTGSIVKTVPPTQQETERKTSSAGVV